MTDLQAGIASLAEQARDRARRAEEQGERGRVVCGGCGGGGWVEVSPTDRSTVQPCQRCRPVTWERWKGGHYAADHWCESCDELRRTQTKGAR